MTFPKDHFPAEAVFKWFCLGWRAELVFNRFKSQARLGHLPKRDGNGARALLYGKLLTALIAEKLVAHAATVSL
ncbi:MAG: hypothetical protein OXC26_17070 [Albidovulum sp.]|nr:hypothetical protein [Albidovulum sp.]